MATQIFIGIFHPGSLGKNRCNLTNAHIFQRGWFKPPSSQPLESLDSIWSCMVHVYHVWCAGATCDGLSELWLYLCFVRNLCIYKIIYIYTDYILYSIFYLSTYQIYMYTLYIYHIYSLGRCKATHTHTQFRFRLVFFYRGILPQMHQQLWYTADHMKWQGTWFVSYTLKITYTPEFNIASEKWWLEDDPFLLGRELFRGYVKLWEGTPWKYAFQPIWK